MKIISFTTGKAKEFALIALNIFKGCLHRCRYCFAPSTLWKRREEFYASANPKDNVLEKLSGETGGRAWYADTSANLKEVFLEVLEEMDTRYLISYQMQEPVQPGWHTLEVKINKYKALEVRARKGYMVAAEAPK